MAEENFGIVVHGGAGVLSNLSNEQQLKIEKKVSKTLLLAYEIIKNGGSSLDAVEFAVSEFEDSPIFNAGRGSVYTFDEIQEMDASIMFGLDRSAGAVASVKTIKNPISLARKVLEETEHVLLVSDGAESFAKDVGEQIVDPSYFHSDKNLKRLRKLKSKITQNHLIQDKIGTVGAVALDKQGNIAAATSTGGMTNKMPGRVGDTPIIGSGTWAQNEVCGVSSTGHGEFFIKFQVAKEVCTRIEYLNQSLEESSTNVIEELKKIGASGGLIAIDKNANISTPFNTDGMIRGSITNKSELNVAIY
ncbi:MAG: isoaspartyl peptidase/L-asparaginase family protein [Gammaproteobacteria bacterium]|tara:strand:- start:42125 stop:43036 length:912 start_codon:yes stop_codon:yes gene_type:complete